MYEVKCPYKSITINIRTYDIHRDLKKKKTFANIHYTGIYNIIDKVLGIIPTFCHQIIHAQRINFLEKSLLLYYRMKKIKKKLCLVR